MTDQRRPYRMKRRAELEALTRLRITKSAVALHGTLGPAHTSISAIAEHAGVRRSTVYRHFPDEAALFAACSSHWRTANPVPELTRIAAFGGLSESPAWMQLLGRLQYPNRNEGWRVNLDHQTTERIERVQAEELQRYGYL